jgi:toxin ParE1/3/4
MKLEIRLSPGAKADLTDATDYYARHAPDVIPIFLDSVRYCFERIIADPHSYPIASGTRVRKAQVRRFPFTVFYTPRSDHVWIYSVFHTSRNPIIWQGRVD